MEDPRRSKSKGESSDEGRSKDKKSSKHKSKKHDPLQELNQDTSEVVMPGENTAAYAMVIKHRVEGYEMNEEHKLIFRESLRKNLVCSSLNDEEAGELSDGAELFEFDRNETICVQGQRGSHFFVVMDGEFDVEIDNSVVNHLGKGDAFGEIALIHNCPRSATVRTTEASRVWGVVRTTFRRVLKQLSTRNFQENTKFLDNVEIFQYLTTQQKSIICQALTVQIYASDADIVREGERGDCMYILKSGELVVAIGQREIRRLKRGDYFGERALLYDEPRSATVKAVVHSMCLSLQRKLLDKVLGNLQHVLFRNIMLIGLKENSLVFSQFTRDQISTLVEAALVRDFPGESVIMAPDTSSMKGVRFLVVLDGEVSVKSTGSSAIQQKLTRGQCFGEEYISEADKDFSHVLENRSRMPCKLALISADAIGSVMVAGNVEATLDFNQKMSVLRKVYVFRYVSNHHASLLVKSFKSAVRKAGEAVIVEGEMGSQFFVIRNGECIVTKGSKTLRTLGKFDYFGERGLLYDEPRSATVTCHKGEVDLWVVDKNVFLQIVEGTMLRHLEERIRLQDTFFSLEDLQVDKIIGRGTFGLVKLVSHKVTKTRYALKCVLRKHTIQHGQEDHIRLEREILAENDHPFIIKLVRTFKDKSYLYFLTELATGGELYNAIRTLGLLTRGQAAFYIASLFLALESLHERDIAYRDLKPENVLLDSQGFIKLIDFGCAKKLSGRSYTLVGTPHYIGPEVILGKGYTCTADIWSVGVCLYEFMCGPLPFGNDTDDHLQIFREILTAKLVFPDYMKDPAAMNIIKRLLCRLPEMRIGCAATGLKDVKDHQFFKDFDWDELLGRTVSPPLVPAEETYQDDVDEAGMEEDPADDDGAPPLEEGDWDKDF